MSGRHWCFQAVKFNFFTWEKNIFFKSLIVMRSCFGRFAIIIYNCCQVNVCKSVGRFRFFWSFLIAMRASCSVLLLWFALWTLVLEAEFDAVIWSHDAPMSYFQCCSLGFDKDWLKEITSKGQGKRCCICLMLELVDFHGFIFISKMKWKSVFQVEFKLEPRSGPLFFAWWKLVS